MSVLRIHVQRNNCCYYFHHLLALKHVMFTTFLRSFNDNSIVYILKFCIIKKCIWSWIIFFKTLTFISLYGHFNPTAFLIHRNFSLKKAFHIYERFNKERRLNIICNVTFLSPAARIGSHKYTLWVRRREQKTLDIISKPNHHSCFVV